MQHVIILTLMTPRPDLRSEALGYSCENTILVQPDKPIGLSKSEWGWNYDCPLRALADGWRLMGPPVKLDGGNWDWWLTRDV